MKNRFALLLALFVISCQSGSKEPTKLLGAKEFSDEMKSDDVVILDVRTPDEVQAGIIAGAVNIDFNDPDFKKSLSDLDKSKKYLVYCASGKRSGKAQDMMLEMGFEKVNALDGGMHAWTAAGLPVTKM